jgi:hypothetical protein
VAGEPDEAAAVGVYDPDLERTAFARGSREGNLAAVGRPARIAFPAAESGELGPAGAIGGDREQVRPLTRRPLEDELAVGARRRGARRKGDRGDCGQQCGESEDKR